MKLSVAMCTYNGAQYLREQLESLASQTRQPDELVVCDDLSSDNTREIIAGFSRTVPFPVRIYCNNKTLGSTKNFEKAIGLCEGDLIALSDQDDVWCKEKLRISEEVFFANPEIGVVFSDGDLVDEQLKPLGFSLWQSNKFGPSEQQLVQRGKAFDLLLQRVVMTGATMVFRSKFNRFILPIPVSFAQEDFVFLHDGWIALLLSAVSEVAFIAEPLFKYRQHVDQQIGAGAHKIASAVEAKKSSLADILFGVRARRNSYEAHTSLLKAVRERMQAHHSQLELRGAIAKVESLLNHLVVRSEMPDSRASRLPVVLKEILSFRYFRYSNGLYSAAKDFLA
ncbi:MAG: glycosyltransferase family 2 protein [Pyrinomonadaceae bacterium]|nr:glycosyltransferase family 2 protein [Pyrinomonadaceae bacterium]